MKKISSTMVFVLLISSYVGIVARTASPGKDLFYSVKGKYGSCNYCHTGGGSAGRWNFETKQIDPDEGKKIPSLKGIGKRKDQEQIERSVKLMQKLFDFKLSSEQISQLAEYLGTI